MACVRSWHGLENEESERRRGGSVDRKTEWKDARTDPRSKNVHGSRVDPVCERATLINLRIRELNVHGRGITNRK